MTADIRTAGAASHAAEGWHTINWKSAYRIVCRLQARIVKAIQEGRWGKVKALQYLLTHSFSGKALAIRRVTENQGKGTPGVDREIWDTPEKKATALQALRQRGYNPQPLRRVYIPKKNGKMRPLGIPTMRDTQITRIEDGFDFLGQNVRDYGGTIVVKPSRKNVATFLEKVRGIIKASKHVTAGHLIVNLNPVIRGWANYHRHVASKRTFSRVDHAIFRALWQWAKRRHPKKSRQWIKDRYFETIDQRHWVFHGTVAGREEVIQPVWLLAASSVPIQRHTKVKGEANPYDLAWEPYFEERLGVKMAGTLAGRWTLRLLWKEQGGICPVCNQKITTATGWHNHHIVWRTHGGKDTIENRVLVHPNCHQQIHSQELDVGKPRPAKGVREA